MGMGRRGIKIKIKVDENSRIEHLKFVGRGKAEHKGETHDLNKGFKLELKSLDEEISLLKGIGLFNIEVFGKLVGEAEEKLLDFKILNVDRLISLKILENNGLIDTERELNIDSDSSSVHK